MGGSQSMMTLSYNTFRCIDKKQLGMTEEEVKAIFAKHGHDVVFDGGFVNANLHVVDFESILRKVIETDWKLFGILSEKDTSFNGNIPIDQKEMIGFAKETHAQYNGGKVEEEECDGSMQKKCPNIAQDDSTMTFLFAEDAPKVNGDAKFMESPDAEDSGVREKELWYLGLVLEKQYLQFVACLVELASKKMVGQTFANVLERNVFFWNAIDELWKAKSTKNDHVILAALALIEAFKGMPSIHKSSVQFWMNNTVGDMMCM
jgi:hypothetical protein